jgi:hypothetical protein
MLIMLAAFKKAKSLGKSFITKSLTEIQIPNYFYEQALHSQENDKE